MFCGEGVRDRAHCPKSARREVFFCHSKSDGRRWAFEGDLERCMSHGRGIARDMFARDVRRSGQDADFLRGAVWEDDFARQEQHFV